MDFGSDFESDLDHFWIHFYDVFLMILEVAGPPRNGKNRFFRSNAHLVRQFAIKPSGFVPGKKERIVHNSIFFHEKHVFFGPMLS